MTAVPLFLYLLVCFARAKTREHTFYFPRTTQTKLSLHAYYVNCMGHLQSMHCGGDPATALECAHIVKII